YAVKAFASHFAPVVMVKNSAMSPVSYGFAYSAHFFNKWHVRLVYGIALSSITSLYVAYPYGHLALTSRKPSIMAFAFSSISLYSSILKPPYLSRSPGTM